MTNRRVATPARGADRGAGLDVTVDDLPHAAVIRLHGGLGSGTVAVLREAVEGVLATGPLAVVLDLTDVVADDELGLWGVPAVAGDAHNRGIGFTVVAPNRTLRSRLRCLGARHVEITDAM